MAMIGYVFIVLGILGGDLWIKDLCQRIVSRRVRRMPVGMCWEGERGRRERPRNR